MRKVSQGHSFRSGFTMIELVFVIVVIGILAAVIIPNTRTNPLQEAAIQVVSHIRYTQHLALANDTFDPDDANWYKQRWQLVFGSNVNTEGVPAYTIFSDTAGGSTGDIQDTEVARNPENANQVMSGGTTGTVSLKYGHNSFIGMKRMNLGMTYGISGFDLVGGCDNARVVFDYLGRPMEGDMSGNAEAYESDNLIQSRCIVRLTHATEGDIDIAIEPETGYACILDGDSNCI